jgi:ribose 5-phosphate isomerase B
MKIAIGSDHAGFHYKEMIKEYLEREGHEVRDFGTFSDDPVDYPLYIRPVAESVVKGDYERGIVLGGSGNGEAMAANRIKGIRCALCWNKESAVLARRHNDANMISIGERMISKEDAIEIIRLWLETSFEGGRHIPRIRMLDDTEASRLRRGFGGQGSQKPEVRMREDGDAGSAESLEKKKKDDFNVVISFGYILYSEGKKQIEFKVDPGLKGPTIIHVPSPDTWIKEMPSWARDRREEIVGRIHIKCKHLVYEIEEY